PPGFLPQRRPPTAWTAWAISTFPQGLPEEDEEEEERRHRPSVGTNGGATVQSSAQPRLNTDEPDLSPDISKRFAPVPQGLQLASCPSAREPGGRWHKRRPPDD